MAGHFTNTPFGGGAVVLVVLLLCADGRAAVEVRGTAKCLANEDIADNLQSELDASSQGRKVDLLLVVDLRNDKRAAAVQLRAISGAGQVVLDRSWVLAPGDCEEGAGLLATVLRRFLTQLPIEQWTLPPEPASEPEPTPPPEPAPVEISAEQPEPESSVTETREPELLLRAGLSTDWLSFGGSLDLGTTFAFGQGTDRLLLSGMLRFSAPQTLGDGNILTAMALVGVGLQHSLNEMMVLAIEARAGALLVFGMGHGTNHSTATWWAEAYGAASWRLGPIAIGPYIAVSPLRHNAQLADTTAERSISSLRVGVMVER